MGGALLSSAGSMDMLDQLSDLQEMTTLPEGSSPGHRTGYWRQTSPGGDALRQNQEGARTPTGLGRTLQRSGRGGGQRGGRQIHTRRAVRAGKGRGLSARSQRQVLSDCSLGQAGRQGDGGFPATSWGESTVTAAHREP